MAPLQGTPPGRIRAPASEDEILALIDRHFPNSHPGLALCRGDDCAIFRRGDFCVSTDLFLENIHFRRAYFEPGEIGHKALAVNISDLATAGSKPMAFTLCLGLPPWADMAFLADFFGGMAALARRHDMALIGGDLSRAAEFHISITAFGEKAGNRDFLRRSGASPGDAIFVAGWPGLARVGFLELEKQGRGAIDAWPCACAAHLEPEPMVEAGLLLGGRHGLKKTPALMDLSDGLARDLPRLLASGAARGLGAELDLRPEMLHPEVLAHADNSGQDPLLIALEGGEDYALLGACAASDLMALEKAVPGLVRIGEVNDCGLVTLNGREIQGGFDHFGRVGPDKNFNEAGK